MAPHPRPKARKTKEEAKETQGAGPTCSAGSYSSSAAEMVWQGSLGGLGYGAVLAEGIGTLTPCG